MKKTLSMVIGFLLGFSAVAEEGLPQLTVTMSTEGPDYYSDGTPVLVGETYLLVYVSQGAAFEGVYTDGSLVDTLGNAVVTTSAAVEGSRCGFKAIQYASASYPSGGSFVIVLLDTRTDAGAVGGLVAGVGTVVAGTTSSSAPSPSGVRIAAEDGTGAPLLTTAAQPVIPAGTPQPVIAAVQPGGESIQVSIRNFAANVNYEVQSKTALTGAWQTAAHAARVNAAQNAAVGADGGTELRAAVQRPQNDTVRFFRVIIPGTVR